nr:hypothetical protein [Tanacetum cinerariifolium]
VRKDVRKDVRKEELHKIVKDENFPIVNQVDARDNTRGTSTNTKFAKQSILGKPPMLGEIHDLSKLVTSNSVPTPQDSKVVNNNKVITPGMFRKRIDNSKTGRPQPRSNTKNDRVPSASKSSRSKNKRVKVEKHHRNVLLSKNTKHMSSACNNIKLDSQNVISKVVCAMCKQCLISVNHDVCLWSPTGRLFDLKGKIIESNESESQSDCSNGDNACTSNTLEPKIKRFPNSTSLLGRLSDLFMVRRLELFQAHDRKSKASHQFCLEVYGNCLLQK